MKTFFLLLTMCCLPCEEIPPQDSALVLNRTISAKNPGAAFALSTFIPGAGMMYNDQVKLGLGVFAVEGLTIYSGLRLLSLYNTDERYHLDINRKMANGLLTGALVIHLGQMVYAALRAEHWNERHGFGRKQKNRLKAGFQPSGIGIGLQID